MKRSIRWATLVAFVVTVVSTGWSVWSTYHRRAQVPQRQAWHEAASQVKAKWRSGDRITWYPHWAEEARLALHDLEPLQLPQRGEVDLGRASRLWVLGAFGYDGLRLIQDPNLKHLQSLQSNSIFSIEHIYRFQNARFGTKS